jgi:transglutaminase-like putative cysteine protease
MSEIASYRIHHRTEYRYSEPVAICQNQVRMIPRSITRPLGTVQCERAKTTILPHPDYLGQHVDYFGNAVCAFSIESLHRHLVVNVRSSVSVHCHEPDPQLAPPWEQVIQDVSNRIPPEWLEIQEFSFPSPRVKVSTTFADYAGKSFKPGRNLFQAGLELTQRIHDDFKYDTDATHVDTETEEAFQLRAGVCQDFAHIQIACLRSLGLPARYVSGYLRTNPPPGKERLVGADESHAWISLYGGSQLGWIDFDPTNACVTNVDHIPVSIGRDYNDVSPMRGVVTGGGDTTLLVSVDVQSEPSPTDGGPA